MSGIFDSLVNSLQSKRNLDKMEKSFYTLYVHHNESDDIDDDLVEPPAFQIPAYMKWRDIIGLIQGEVKCDLNTSFAYYDDENDEIRIDSQEEYETALHVCRKDKRDLHIYTVQPGKIPKKKKKRKADKKEDFTLLAEDKPQEAPKEMPPPPSFEETQRTNSLVHEDETEDTSLPQEGAVGGVPIEPMLIEAASACCTEAEGQETKPMPQSCALINVIRKEAREAIAAEVDEIWAFMKALKRDLNEELDAIGEQLASHSAQLPEVQRHIQDHLMNRCEATSSETSDSEISSKTEDQQHEEEDADGDEDQFAASFICESLLDGSKVDSGSKFEKHWVFRNDGKLKWNENTKLHLLQETCEPPVATGPSLSEWGAVSKSVPMPHLKKGESGVVCAEHFAPAHPCNYNSSWRLSHENTPFGPRVWCNIRIEEESGSPVDSHPKSLESFVELNGEAPREAEPKPEELHESLIPTGKVQIAEEQSPKLDNEDGHHSDENIMSFDMADISDGAKQLQSTPSHEAPLFNPAVTSVEREKEEEHVDSQENVGASVDGEDHSVSSESPVLVTPPGEQVPELDNDEEPLTLENEEKEDKTEDIPDADVNEVENFTEQVIRTPGFSSDEETEEDSPEVQSERSEDAQALQSSTEDLHSVDYTVEEEPQSMMSYASDFVVVPLPDCFDVNKPLNGSECEENEEDQPPSVAENPVKAETKMEQAPKEEEDPASRFPPEEESESESEPDSQPASVTRPNDYQSEDSMISNAHNTNSSPTSPPVSFTPKVTLAPTFGTPDKDDTVPSGGATPQPESVDNESLTERITKEFDEFLANPAHPVSPTLPPKLTMNEMAETKKKIPVYQVEPQPVPASVLNQDEPYRIPNAETPPTYAPFDQGWRRNPIPVPASVNNDEPWSKPEERPTPAPRSASQLPRSEFTLDPIPAQFGSALPSEPFAVASPSESISTGFPRQDSQNRRRPPSPEIQIADDFHPVGGAFEAELDDSETYSTPPGTPSPIRGRSLELSPLDQLYEMGFHDLDLNRNIFESCGRDLNRAVQALVLRAEADQGYNDVA